MLRDVRTDGGRAQSTPYCVPLSLYLCSRRLVPFQSRAMLMTERRRLGHAPTGIGMPSVSTLIALEGMHLGYGQPFQSPTMY